MWSLNCFLSPIFVTLVFTQSNADQTRLQTVQCQCEPGAQNSPCLSYDSKFQADTLEDAIAFFPDLSIDSTDQKEETDLGCETEYCQNCRREMRKRLEKVGLLSPSVDTNSIRSTQNVTCQKYSFSMENFNTKDIDEGESDSESDSSASEEKTQSSKRKVNREKKNQRRSKRFSSSDLQAGLIGTRFSISCSKKGVTVDPTGTVSLCSSCWVWRRLPDNYRPQYINELICDQSDDSCLSGYAHCAIGHRTIEAVRNESGLSIPVSLAAGSYCECRIPTSSSLQSLVTGSGISGTFTPLLNNSNTVGLV